tara:strand:- start:10234 stop:11526 length:1293 start_codon:yes stop_codon:yes gene_type:complete
MLRSKTIPQTQIIPTEESDDGIITAAVLESKLIETKDLIGEDIEDVQESIDKKTEGYFQSLISQMQGVNNNLEAISDTIKKDMRDRKRYFDMQKELFEDDEENLKNLRNRSGGGGNLFGGLLNKALLGLGLFTAPAVIPQLFPDTVKTETDKNVDQSIEEKGRKETADLLKSEEENKKKERNFIQNFFYGTIMGEDAEYDKQIERAETGEEPVFNIGKDKVNTDEKNENIDGLNQDVKSGELVEPKRDDYPNTRSGAKIYQDAKKSFDEASKQISETSTKISETNKDISEKPGKPIKNKRGRIIGYENVDESIKNVTFDDFNEEIDDIDSKTSNTLKKYNNITKKEELSNLILDEKKSESKNKFEDIFEMSSDISDGAGEVSILNIEGTTKNELTPNIDTGTTNASKNIDFDPEKSGQERFESSIALGVF